MSFSKADEVFEREKPDALLLYGDTNTCLAADLRQTSENSGVSHGGRQ